MASSVVHDYNTCHCCAAWKYYAELIGEIKKDDPELAELVVRAFICCDPNEGDNRFYIVNVSQMLILKGIYTAHELETIKTKR